MDWYKWGDLNTFFFHLVTTVRKTKNKIIKIIVDDGSEICEQKKREEFLLFKFKDMLCSHGIVDSNVWYWEIPCQVVSYDENNSLNVIPSKR